jgi:hypothetical protein
VICSDFTCQPPIADPAQLEKTLQEIASRSAS